MNMAACEGSGMVKAGEKRLVQLASKQFDLVTAREFAKCQLSRSWLRRRMETGEWTQLHRGIFKLGSSTPNPDQLEMAAMLAAGDGAVLSHASAARRLGLDVPRSQAVQITIPASRDLVRLSGVQVWRSRDLIESDITKRGPFRLTHLARTMIDLASVLDDAWLRATLDSALRQRSTNLAWIFRALREHGKGRRGAERLRALLAEYRNGNEVPDSVLESLCIELAMATGRKPKRHWNVLDGNRLIEVDLAWPEVRLCVELDGWTEHGTRAAFVRDRARDRALLRLGWVVLRYTWQDVTGDRESVIAELLSTYDSRALSLRAASRRTGRAPPRANS
jgi:very-short-patch-repair endonuclease